MNTLTRFAALAWLAASSAQAGTWVGGGGELIRDTINPWFIGNTPVVKTCIEWDPEHFHLPAGMQDLQKDFVLKAVAYWQDELAVAAQTAPAANLRIGTQDFQFAPCAQDTVLRIQFGLLKQDQRDHLNQEGYDVRQVVSLAVRTDYDPVTLSGKGFIYISADSGELRPHAPSLLAQPWVDADGQHLLKVLVHEFGHVFGVPHTRGYGSIDNEVMNASFPEWVVSQDASQSASSAPVPAFFKASEGGGLWLNCDGLGMSGRVVDFFQLPAANLCLHVKRQGNHLELENTTSGIAAGSVELTGTPTPVHSETVVRIFLSAQQQVVAQSAASLGLPLDAGVAPYIGPVRTIYSQTGIFRPAAGGPQRRVLVTLLPGGSLRLSGLLDAGEVLDLSEHLPLSMMRTTP